MRHLIPALAFLASSLVPAAGQDLSRLMEEARLAETAEGDLEKAASIYAQVANRADAYPDPASHALFRQGLCLLKIDPKGARAALERAVNSKGAYAAAARTALEEGPQEDGRLGARVAKALALLRAPQTATEGRRELEWLGPQAVADILKSIRDEQLDLKFVSRAVQVLVKTGGKDVVEFLKEARRSKDVLMRRAVISGLDVAPTAPSAVTAGQATGSQTQRLVGPDLREAIVSFTKDPDPRARLDAVNETWPYMTQEERWECLEDESIEIRLAFIDRMSYEAISTAMTLDAGRLVPHLKKIVDAGNETWTRRALSALPFLGQSPAGHVLAVSWLTDPEVTRILETSRSNYNFNQGAITNAEDAIPPKAIMAAGRAISGPANGIPSTMLRQIVSASSPHWKPSINEILELLQLGLADQRIEQGIHEKMTSEDIPRVVRLVDRLRFDPARVFSRFFGTPLDGETLVAVKETIERLRSNEKYRGTRDALLGLLYRVDDPEVGPYLLGIARTDPMHGHAARETLTWRTARFPKEADHLIEILLDSKTPEVDRNGAFLTLGSVGSPDAVSKYAKAYELGLAQSSIMVQRDSDLPGTGKRSIQVTGRGILGLLEVMREKRSYDEETLARIIESLFENPTHAALEDLSRIAQSKELSSNEIDEILCKHALTVADRSDIDDRLLSRGLGMSPRRQVFWDLLIRGFKDSREKVRRRYLDKFIDELECPEHEQLLIELAASLSGDDARKSAWVLATKTNDTNLLEKLADHEHKTVRHVALTGLIRLQPERTFDLVSRALNDPDLQASGAEMAEVFLDRRHIPSLVKLLKSPTLSLRERAQKALESIRYYEDQKARWDDFYRDAGLNETSALRALLSQAKPEEPKHIRLAAIRSLGTLGAVECLPILINYMKDTDEDIKAAAAAAIDRVNTRASEAPKSKGP